MGWGLSWLERASIGRMSLDVKEEVGLNVGTFQENGGCIIGI